MDEESRDSLTKTEIFYKQVHTCASRNHGPDPEWNDNRVKSTYRVQSMYGGVKSRIIPCLFLALAPLSLSNHFQFGKFQNHSSDSTSIPRFLNNRSNCFSRCSLVPRQPLTTCADQRKYSSTRSFVQPSGVALP